jgi:signal transduction histidine kinase
VPDTYAATVVSDDLVRAVSQIAEGLDLPVVLDRLIDAARQATGARYAALGVLGPDGLHEEFRHVGLAPEQVAQMGELPRGHGVLGMITREKAAVVTDDIKGHPASVGFPPGHPPMGAFLGVPLRVRGVTFGNLYLTDKDGGFDDEDRRTVEALAAAASVAVDNARLYRSARNREAWAEAAGAVTAALLGGLDEEDALQVVVRHARRVAHADAAVLALPGMDGVPVVEVVDGGVGDHDLVGLGLPAVRALGDTVSCPVADGEGETGVLVLVRSDGHRRFGPDDVAGAESFAAQASLSLRLAAERRRGEGRVLLDERARIARDLHDLAVQQLFAVGIELGRLKESLDVGTGLDPRLGSHVDSALDGLDTAVEHIRATIRPLRTEVRRATVAEQVARTVSDAAVVLGFEPELVDRTLPDDAEQWDEQLVHDLLAALGEALANVARHSRASSARIDLTLTDGRLRLVVEDDGVGVPAEPVRSSGLANLQARARLHGGHCTVLPLVTGGTRVEWAVPVDRP